MKKSTYKLSMLIDVFDEQALFEAALKHAMDEDHRVTEENAREMLAPGGEIDPGQCLIMLLDPGVSPPGCEIENSSTERLDSMLEGFETA